MEDVFEGNEAEGSQADDEEQAEFEEDVGKADEEDEEAGGEARRRTSTSLNCHHEALVRGGQGEV